MNQDEVERHEELMRRLRKAVKLIEQYRAEIRSRPDLMEDGFCQGAYFSEEYAALKADLDGDD